MHAYILKDKTPVLCNLSDWAEQFEKSNRSIAVHHDPDMRGNVSTVFLGLDHGYGDGPPILFETMIFGGPHDQYQTRCSTYEQALAMHERAIQKLSEAGER